VCRRKSASSRHNERGYISTQKYLGVRRPARAGESGRHVCVAERAPPRVTTRSISAHSGRLEQASSRDRKDVAREECPRSSREESRTVAHGCGGRLLEQLDVSDCACDGDGLLRLVAARARSVTHGTDADPAPLLRSWGERRRRGRKAPLCVYSGHTRHKETVTATRQMRSSLHGDLEQQWP
jgi:hypothetical protein